MQSGAHTIGSCIQDDEACVDYGLAAVSLEDGGVGVASKTVCGLEEVDVVVGALECPESAYSRDAAADDGDFLRCHCEVG